jgi:2-methylisocitrate lyase-like PEP mutase family enzyme
MFARFRESVAKGEIPMVDSSLRAKAETFRALHREGVFVLPNAWDAGSAVMIAKAGAPAVATTSAGVSWSLGRPDGEHLSRAEMIDVIARVAAAVDVPVSADVEGGYGDDPAAVAETVRAVIGAGAAGINLEDSRSADGTLHDPAAQAARIAAGRAAAAEAGLPGLVINARTDVYLFGIGDPAGRFDDVVARAASYAEAGADSLFVPGLSDLETLTELTGRVALPVNVMAGPGSPDVKSFGAAGVRRVTVGQMITQAAYSLARRAAAELLATGTYDTLAGADDFGAVNGSFPRR